MTTLATSVALLIVLVGCANPEDEQAKDDANLWAAMGYEGEPPAHDESDIRTAISRITDRSNDIIINGSSDDDCEPFHDAFKVLLFADFNDSRQDYIDPLSNALSQVYSGCNDRGTWEGAIDDVLIVSELGGEYLSRF